MPLTTKQTPISDLTIIQPQIYEDKRGAFHECFRADEYEKVGIPGNFVQDNISHSTYGVIRGLHFQIEHPQGKLVSCVKGKILDVAVDLRGTSPTFGQYYSVILDSEQKNQLWIPEGFAHGFSVLSATATVLYKCTDYYHPEDEGGIGWNDSELGIDWKVIEPKVSVKDAMLPKYKDVLKAML